MVYDCSSDCGDYGAGTIPFSGNSAIRRENKGPAGHYILSLILKRLALD